LISLSRAARPTTGRCGCPVRRQASPMATSSALSYEVPAGISVSAPGSTSQISSGRSACCRIRSTAAGILSTRSAPWSGPSRASTSDASFSGVCSYNSATRLPSTRSRSRTRDSSSCPHPNSSSCFRSLVVFLSWSNCLKWSPTSVRPSSIVFCTLSSSEPFVMVAVKRFSSSCARLLAARQPAASARRPICCCSRP